MRQVAHVLLTRPPLASLPKEIHSLDLHVLGTPPAFVLSQDQTLTKKFNHLLKLLWVFVLRLSKELLVYFNYILFNFQRPFTLSHRSDFLILSLRNFSVNTFFSTFFLVVCANKNLLSFVGITCAPQDKIYDITLNLIKFFQNILYFKFIFDFLNFLLKFSLLLILIH